MATKKPNILVLWGDDVGWWNISYNSRGQMGYRTPNIDRVGNEGVAFTDYYAQQSCTAGRAAFITGQNPIRTGLTRSGCRARRSAAEGGPHDRGAPQAARLRDRPVRQEPPGRQGRVPAHDARFRRVLRQPLPPERRGGARGPGLPEGPRVPEAVRTEGRPHCWADGKGGQKIEDTGPLTKKRMETIDDEVTDHALRFLDDAHKSGKPFFLWWNTTAMHFRTHPAEKHKGKSGQGTTTT